MAHSYYDIKDRLMVACSECERGGNGNDKDKCSCGWKIRRGGRMGCFSGTLMQGVKPRHKRK